MNRRTGQAVGAAILLIVGTIWIFQGVGALGGSPMTGVTFWAWAGAICVVAGAVLGVRAFQRR